MFKAAVTLAASCALAIVIAPIALGGPDGSYPGPGLCDYPGVGQSGLVGVVPYYYCDFPTEANGTHWHCEAGGVALNGGAFTASNGFGIGGLGQFGFNFGSCYFKWPDGQLAPPPNPPGAWKDFLVPRPIPADHAAPPQPYDQTVDVAPPPVENNIPTQDTPPPIVNQPLMDAPVKPGDPQVMPPGPDGRVLQAPQGIPHQSEAVTNPDNPNPGATENPDHH